MYMNKLCYSYKMLAVKFMAVWKKLAHSAKKKSHKKNLHLISNIQLLHIQYQNCIMNFVQFSFTPNRFCQREKNIYAEMMATTTKSYNYQGYKFPNLLLQFVSFAHFTTFARFCESLSTLLARTQCQKECLFLRSKLT
jgi:hypothetical protein